MLHYKLTNCICECVLRFAGQCCHMVLMMYNIFIVSIGTDDAVLLLLVLVVMVVVVVVVPFSIVFYKM